jgi:hypothetical protein
MAAPFGEINELLGQNPVLKPQRYPRLRGVSICLTISFA